jgi:glycosyltransferase involved in cell wall biosynthesis
MSRRVVIHWGLSSLHGWGVYGLNLALAWAGDPALEAATDYEVVPQHLTLDPLQAHALAGFRARSAKLRAELLRQKPEVLTLNAVLLAALGNDLQPQPGPHGGKLLGRPSLGTVFFEREALGPKAREALAPHAAIIAGSSWNAGVLRAHGAPTVELVLQGIDPALFHPAPRRGLFPGRFVVFSGGKLEVRKGQDNVIAAWRSFAARHPDALLISAGIITGRMGRAALMLPAAPRHCPSALMARHISRPGSRRMASSLINSSILAWCPMRCWRRYCARQTPPSSPIAAKAAPILWRWKPWPAVCQPSSAPIPAILI